MKNRSWNCGKMYFFFTYCICMVQASKGYKWVWMRDVNIFIRCMPFVWRCYWIYLLLFGCHCHSSTTVAASTATCIICYDNFGNYGDQSAHHIVKSYCFKHNFPIESKDISIGNHFFCPFLPFSMNPSIWFVKLLLTRHRHTQYTLHICIRSTCR